jgi:hypothetical protein
MITRTYTYALLIRCVSRVHGSLVYINSQRALHTSRAGLQCVHIHFFVSSFLLGAILLARTQSR